MNLDPAVAAAKRPETAFDSSDLQLLRSRADHEKRCLPHGTSREACLQLPWLGMNADERELKTRVG